MCDEGMMPLVELPLNTPSDQSMSFANPNIRRDKNNRFFLSFFLPFEGNDPNESGNLIYYIDVPKYV